jgi:signal transduction histidine kinase
MHAADDSPDRVVYDAADQLRHDLLSPLTTISARAQFLERTIRRSPALADEERVKMLVGITAIETAVESLCAVIDAMNLPSRDGQAAPADGER